MGKVQENSSSEFDESLILKAKEYGDIFSVWEPRFGGFT